MASRIRSHVTYANVMATVAVFIAFGGGAYAAIRLPKNSVGTTQLKPNAVSSPKVRDGSLLAADFRAGQLPVGPKGDAGPKGDTGPAGQPGAQGLQGPKGDAATTLFASVTSAGVLTYGSGVSSVQRTNLGQYSVTFNRNLTNCVAMVTIGAGEPQAAVNTIGQGYTGAASIYDNYVAVRSYDSTAALADSGFHVAVFC